MRKLLNEIANSLVTLDAEYKSWVVIIVVRPSFAIKHSDSVGSDALIQSGSLPPQYMAQYIRIVCDLINTVRSVAIIEQITPAVIQYTRTTNIPALTPPR